MTTLAYMMALILSAMGLTIVIVWPASGPGAAIREKALRPLLPGQASNVLDCYICLGFWSGLLLSPLWWWMTRQHWVWAGCLMTSAVFWIILHNPSDPSPPEGESPEDAPQDGPEVEENPNDEPADHKEETDVQSS